MYSIWNDFFFVPFRNGHFFYNIVSTLTNVVKLDVEKDNLFSTLPNVAHNKVETYHVYLTLFDAVYSKVEIHNVVSTLIWGCATSRHHINKTQRWNNVEMFAGNALVKTALYCMIYIKNLTKTLTNV